MSMTQQVEMRDFAPDTLQGFPEASSIGRSGNENQTQDSNTIADNQEHQSESSIDNVFKYLVLLAASLILFIGVGYTNTYGVFESYYQVNLFPDLPPSKLIVIGSVSGSLYLVFGAFAGRFADLMGYRTSLLIGSALMAGSMFAASVSKTYMQLFLSQGLAFGLGVAFVYLPAVTISRQYWSSRRHGITNGIVVSGGALGGLILPYICRRLIDQRGISSTFRFLGYLALGVLVPCCFLLRPKHRTVLLWENQSRNSKRPPIMDLTLLKNTQFLALVTSGTIAMTGFLPRYFLIPPSAIAQGITPSYASWLLGMMNGLSIVGRVGIGWYADRFGKVNALSASFILCGLGHFVFWLPGVTISTKEETAPLALFTLFVVYTGIFGSGFVSLFPVVVAHLFGSDKLASKVGLLNTVIGLGTLAGPSAVYAIVGDQGGQGAPRNWTVGVLSAGLFMFMGGVFLLGSLSWTGRRQREFPEREE